MHPALPLDSSVSALRCVLLQRDATLTNLARSLFARRDALRQDAALCAMFVGARSVASTHGPVSERNAALLQPMERCDRDPTICRFDDALGEGGQLLRRLSSCADPVGAFCRQALNASPSNRWAPPLGTGPWAERMSRTFAGRGSTPKPPEIPTPSSCAQRRSASLTPVDDTRLEGRLYGAKLTAQVAWLGGSGRPSRVGHDRQLSCPLGQGLAETLSDVK